MAEDELRREFLDNQDIVIEEFQKRTPGYLDQHITNANEEGNAHEHSGTYEYTQELVEGWIFTEGGTLNSIAEVINISPHAINVEYGQIINGVDIHNGGHRMIASTLMHSPVRDYYAQAAGKALLVALGTFNYSQRSKLAGDAGKGAGFKKDGANVYWRKGRITVRGAQGRGATSGTIKRVLENLSNQLVTMFNSGRPI